jgi:hypothetical protein
MSELQSAGYLIGKQIVLESQSSIVDGWESMALQYIKTNFEFACDWGQERGIYRIIQMYEPKKGVPMTKSYKRIGGVSYHGKHDVKMDMGGASYDFDTHTVDMLMEWVVAETFKEMVTGPKVTGLFCAICTVEEVMIVGTEGVNSTMRTWRFD